MTLSENPGATLEEIDQAIADAGSDYGKTLEDLHAIYLTGKAELRHNHRATVKELSAYRVIIARKHQGGAE